MAAFGASPAVVAKTRAAARALAVDDSFRVHPDNVTAIRLYMALQTQWRSVALSTWSQARVLRTGLDYAAVEPTARLEGLELTADDFRRLRSMELDALTAWAEERSRET